LAELLRATECSFHDAAGELTRLDQHPKATIRSRGACNPALSVQSHGTCYQSSHATQADSPARLRYLVIQGAQLHRCMYQTAHQGTFTPSTTPTQQWRIFQNNKTNFVCYVVNRNVFDAATIRQILNMQYFTTHVSSARITSKSACPDCANFADTSVCDTFFFACRTSRTIMSRSSWWSCLSEKNQNAVTFVDSSLPSIFASVPAVD
jgi:hypothetical protein